MLSLMSRPMGHPALSAAPRQMRSPTFARRLSRWGH
jgi:hypothetical protein